mmetsp:Transcript_58373/g.130092  ORF Transcript_58373/g.130092 Transcript_58373/m.130092 type:complete len:253 (-) Transcript_58373:265-1023(-)
MIWRGGQGVFWPLELFVFRARLGSRLGVEDVINHRVDEYARDGDGGAHLFLKRELLTESDCGDDHHDHSFRGIRDRGGNGAGLLDGHGRKLVVQVERHAGENHVLREHGIALELADKGAKVLPFEANHYGERDEEPKHLGESELIADASNAILEPLCLHQLGVLRTLDRGKDIRNRCHGEGGQVKLDGVGARCCVGLEAREDDASDDDGQAQPLSDRGGIAVHEGGHQRGEYRFSSLNDLAKRKGACVQSQH